MTGPAAPAAADDPAGALDFHAMAHGVLGALWAMLSLVPAIWVYVGYEVASSPGLHDGAAPPVPSAAVTAVALLVLVAGLAGGGFVAWGARALARRRGYRTALAGTVVLALFVPLGTVFAALTWLELRRPAVRAAFTR